MKDKAFVLFFSFLLFFWMTGCEEDVGGNCSISCGGSGTGQPFVQTNTPGLSEEECRKKGEKKGGGCRTAFCPPTGDPSDCYQVYP